MRAPRHLVGIALDAMGVGNWAVDEAHAVATPAAEPLADSLCGRSVVVLPDAAWDEVWGVRPCEMCAQRAG